MTTKKIPPPWPHQQQGTKLFTEGGDKGLLLYMEMGCGKTRTTIDAIASLCGSGGDVLILCPKSVVAVWMNEFELWWPEPTMRTDLVGARRRLATGLTCSSKTHPMRLLTFPGQTGRQKVARIRDLMREPDTGPVSETRIVVLNYQSAITSEVGRFLCSIRWGVVILDESHYVKDPHGVTAKLVHRLQPIAKRRLCLSGTPMPHSPLDIWSQFMFLNPSIFGRSFVVFRNRYAEMGVQLPRNLSEQQRQKITDLGTVKAVHIGRLLTTVEFKSAFRKSIADAVKKWIASPRKDDPLTGAQWAALGKVDAKHMMTVVAWRNGDELSAKMDRITYRVRTADVLKLPNREHQTRLIDLEPAAYEKYLAMERDFVLWLSETKAATAPNVLVRLLRLMQITSGFVPVEQIDEADSAASVVDQLEKAPMVNERVSTAKEDATEDIFSSIDPAEPIVVFAIFRHDIDVIREVAKRCGRESFELSGRENSLEAWKAAPGGAVIVVQQQSGGVGISLVRAMFCIYYSISFSLGLFDQSIARIHRPGQVRDVTYFHLVAAGTVDAKVYEALNKRRDVVNSVLDALTGSEKDSEP